MSNAKADAGLFTLPIVVGFLLTPAAGVGAGLLFGLTNPDNVLTTLHGALLPAFLLAIVAWTTLYFRRYLRPLLEWVDSHPHAQNAPGHLQRRLGRFTRDYWSMFLLYALTTPAVFFAAVNHEFVIRDLPRFANFLLLQLAVAVLIGLPGYLIALDRLGRLVARLGLDTVQISLKSKTMLLGGFVPLLSYAVLVNYYWRDSGHLSLGLIALWGALALITGLVTVLSIRGMAQALGPVQDVLGRSGASTHGDLARLRPQSTDEIGVLTQTLSRLFRRLGDQESQMRAVVDTAAEGIVVVDEQGRIDTFNAAAEQLFGYLAHEIRGRSLSRLLPRLVAEGEAPPVSTGEQELSGLHRNGRPIPVSVRVSAMHISGQPMYTCLVADITKRKSAESQLMDAQARYRDLVETAHDLVWSVDPEGHWVYLNGACRGIYGYEPDDMVGRHIHEFCAPQQADSDGAAFSDVLAGNELVLHETVHLDRQGSRHHLSFNAKAHRDEQGNIIHISGTARDITEQKAFQQQLAYQAEHDSLTGLFNRHYFQQELGRTVARTARSDSGCALCYIDLDQFKYINDTLGHAAGDQLLVEISELLDAHVREGDLLARFGGDEFTLLLYNVDSANALRAAEHFRVLFDNYKFFYDGKTFNITCSIGAALIDGNASSADEVLSHADLACNMAKAQGRNRINLYNPADRDKAGMAEDMGWAARVREMLERDRFQLVYQPIVSVNDGRVHDYEVLVRMVCDDGEVILPGGFMPAAERFGLIHSVDRWIVSRAINQLSTLRRRGHAVCFSINLSGKAFEDDALLPLIHDRLAETGLNPSWLTFEITESAAIANLSAANRFIHALKDIGCQFALDDFGSGFSSFTYLKHLPVDKLKIDGSFVQGLANTPVDQAMVQSMNQVAHALGKRTVAEYVENAETLKLLKAYGVDYAQGNYIGKPREALMNIALPSLAAISTVKQ
ncbi:MAG: EAL domain-containing protein [Gammaproteobacteria bacterium]